MNYIMIVALSMRELAKRVNLSAPSTAERVRKLTRKWRDPKYTSISIIKAGLVLDCILEITLKNGIQHVCNSLFSPIHLQVLLPRNRELMLHCKNFCSFTR